MEKVVLRLPHTGEIELELLRRLLTNELQLAAWIKKTGSVLSCFSPG